MSSSATLYRATIYLHGGARAVVDFEYEEPDRGHRLDPDGYVPAHHWITRIELDGIDLKPKGNRTAAQDDLFRETALDIQANHKADMTAAVREVHKVEWESLFA